MMKLIPVKDIPSRHYKACKLQSALEEFSKMDAKIVMIDPIAEGYSTPNGMVSSMWKAIKRYGYPMKVHLCQGKIYLEKTI